MSNRTDENGYTTKVTFLGKGWGIRVLKQGRVIMQDFVTSKGLIGPCLKSMLRMVDKCGFNTPMATASRDRFYCGRKAKSCS
jgi:hypothetical protein